MFLISLFIFLVIGSILLVYVPITWYFMVKLDSLEPNVNWCSFALDFDIGHCCKLHDFRYGQGGTEKDRKYYDRLFRLSIIQHGYDEGQAIRYIILAWIYYFGVRYLGWTGFVYKGK